MSAINAHVKAVYTAVKALRERLGAPWFTKPWDLNCVIARSGAVGAWDDLVLFACNDDAGRPVVFTTTATGDAWTGEWTNPTHPNGCIYVLDGHYKRGFAIGKHKGRPALVQRADFRYVRWPKGMGRPPSVSELVARAEAGHAFTDNRGTHLHNRVSDRTPEAPETDDSEGCTVNLYYHEHYGMMKLVEVQKSRRGTTIVSPTFCQRATLGL